VICPVIVPFQRFAYHQLRPPSRRPFVGPPPSSLSLSRSAQRPSIIASILQNSSSADAVVIPGR
jgi:hypothetical protein